jgi:NTE family protein
MNLYLPRFKSVHWTRLVTILLATLVCGCGSIYPPVNEPISVVDEVGGYRATTPGQSQVRGDHFIVLAFSGGGTRASALSYGVMQELRDTTIARGGKKIGLLNEVDTISSVSGGSFTAAYYGVFGDRLFEDFEPDFLRQNVQSTLFRRLFRPSHWLKSIFSGFDRTEMAVDYYDQTIFKGATFADIPRENHPFILINATDLGNGQRFEFTQRAFDLLCSDIGSFPIARAVTASSAVPVVFPPVPLKNHAAECDLEAIKERARSRLGETQTLEQQRLIESYKRYRDSVAHPYIHLVDGGISDNLGLRVVIEKLDLYGKSINERLLTDPPSSILVILVNAETNPDRLIGKTAAKPSVRATVDAMSSTQISRYNIETRTNLKRKLESLQKESRAGGVGTQVYFSEVRFSSIQDQRAKSFFNNLPTTLELDDSEIDTLIASARYLLRREPEFQRFLRQNSGAREPGSLSDRDLCALTESPDCLERLNLQSPIPPEL